METSVGRDQRKETNRYFFPSWCWQVRHLDVEQNGVQATIAKVVLNVDISACMDGITVCFSCVFMKVYDISILEPPLLSSHICSLSEWRLQTSLAMEEYEAAAGYVEALSHLQQSITDCGDAPEKHRVQFNLSCEAVANAIREKLNTAAKNDDVEQVRYQHSMFARGSAWVHFTFTGFQVWKTVSEARSLKGGPEQNLQSSVQGTGAFTVFDSLFFNDWKKEGSNSTAKSHFTLQSIVEQSTQDRISAEDTTEGEGSN